MALGMWEKLQFSEIDSSVLSKVINGNRLFTFRQLRVFCDLLDLNRNQRKVVFEALIKDKLGEFNLDNNKDIHLAFAKLSYYPHQKTPKLGTSSKKLFQKIITTIAPRFNQKSKLGVIYTKNCYYHFITKGVQKYNGIIEKEFANFDVSIPICDFTKTVKGLENNCRCGYHLALYGIIKEYLRKRVFSRERIQNKLNRWIAFFFPKEAVLKYLENSSSLDTQSRLLLRELKASI